MRSIAVMLALLTATAVAAAESLQTFLEAVTAATRPKAVVRGDGELVTTSPDGTQRDRIAVIRGPSGDIYYELRDAGIRALVMADGTKAWIVPGKGEDRETFALDAAFGGSEFTREDLRPFNVALVRAPAVADRSPEQVTVSLTPRSSQYAHQAITFDRERKVPLVTKNYHETASNLVKMRTDDEWVEVAGTWLPTRIKMENFPLRVVSTITLKWAPADQSAALLEPAALDAPSPLTWPTP